MSQRIGVAPIRLGIEVELLTKGNEALADCPGPEDSGGFRFLSLVTEDGEKFPLPSRTDRHARRLRAALMQSFAKYHNFLPLNRSPEQELDEPFDMATRHTEMPSTLPEREQEEEKLGPGLIIPEVNEPGGRSDR